MFIVRIPSGYYFGNRISRQENTEKKRGRLNEAVLAAWRSQDGISLMVREEPE
jgi:hypothetical protein